jgi:hypothetical protein
MAMEESQFPGKSEKQEGLIRKYCAEADSVLADAPDYDSAVLLKDSLCNRFQKECDSSLVVAATTLHLDNLLRLRWGRR